LELANKGWIVNCNVTRQGILNAEHVGGPDPGSLKGKTVRKASDQVRYGGLVPIPGTIMAHYWKVVLCVYVMKVNKMTFLVKNNRGIKFGTVAWLKTVEAETILAHITEVHNAYVKRVFLLEIVKVDGQFEPIRGALAELGITLNKCSREEHVPVAERRIHTLKERCKCICNTLPFKKLPGMVIVQMVITCNFWLNIFPPKDGVSRNINLRELITGVKIDSNKQIQAECNISLRGLRISVRRRACAPERAWCHVVDIITSHICRTGRDYIVPNITRTMVYTYHGAVVFHCTIIHKRNT
jgi:hypothetical protein